MWLSCQYSSCFLLVSLPHSTSISLPHFKDPSEVSRFIGSLQSRFGGCCAV